MQVTLEKTGPCQAKIHFTVGSDEFQAAYRQALQKVSQNAQMKGFRPGKVPPRIVEKQFGPQLRGEAIEQFVRQAYEQAVGENELKVVGFQRVNLDQVQIEDGSDWTHQFEVSLRPEIELPEYKGIEVESELEPVMDQELDAALQNLRAQQSRPEPAGAAGLPADGMAVATVRWFHGEQQVLERENLRLSPGSPTPGCDALAFKAMLTGAQDGATLELAMVFPQELEPAMLRGQAGTTRIEIKQAYRLLPPTDADLRAMFAVEDDAGLRAALRTRIEEAKRQQEDQRQESAIIERLLERQRFDLPAMMVEEQTRARLEQLAAQARQEGATPEQVAQRVDAQKATAREATERGLRALFLVQAIGERERLLVSREDLEQELGQIAARNRADLEEVRKYYKEKGLFDQMAVELLERKVRAFLRQHARVTTPS